MDGMVILEEDGRTVSIKDVQIEDENLYNFLGNIDENKRIDCIVSAIQIGAIGLKRMAVGEELDYVEKEFSSMVTKFDRMFDPEVKTSHLGKFSLLRLWFET